MTVRDTEHKDLPRDQAMTLANRLIASKGGPEKCKVHFKFTCRHCGARQTFEQANTIFTEGDCEACGKTTKIKAYGMMVIFGGKDD
jgi:hypothetical protein